MAGIVEFSSALRGRQLIQEAARDGTRTASLKQHLEWNVPAIIEQGETVIPRSLRHRIPRDLLDLIPDDNSGCGFSSSGGDVHYHFPNVYAMDRTLLKELTRNIRKEIKTMDSRGKPL